MLVSSNGIEAGLITAGQEVGMSGCVSLCLLLPGVVVTWFVTWVGSSARIDEIVVIPLGSTVQAAAGLNEPSKLPAGGLGVGVVGAQDPAAVGEQLPVHLLDS